MMHKLSHANCLKVAQQDMTSAFTMDEIKNGIHSSPNDKASGLQ